MKELDKIEENYKKLIRKLPTYNLIEYFSKKSLESFQSDRKGVTSISLPYCTKNGARGRIENFIYGQWELIEICYHSILYSNDYRNGKPLDENNFYNLINANKLYSEKREIQNDVNLYSFLQCLTNVQFDFQHMPVKANFNRMYHILMNINKNTQFAQDKSISYINFGDKFKSITNIEYEKFTVISIFLVTISCTRRNVNIYDIIDNIQFDVLNLGFSKNDIEKVIILLSRDYKFYKTYNNWNLLRYYPIVKTNERTPRYLISNIYALYFSLPDMAYWIIRNYYAELKKDDFNIYFGRCFEFYLQELLEYYKIKYEYIEKIKDQKTPDWKIETEKFIFLIEQKSSIFPIDARTTTGEHNIKKLEQYIERNIVKALKQLDSFVIQTQKTVIRICLTFEKIYMEENIKCIIGMKQAFKTDKDLMWIVNIDEFEILMQILNKDESCFNKIIQDKIYLEKVQDKNGRTFSKLLIKYENTYAEKILGYLDNIAENFLKTLKE